MHFAPLSEIEGVELLSLQVGNGTEQLAKAREIFSINDLGGRLDLGAFSPDYSRLFTLIARVPVRWDCGGETRELYRIAQIPGKKAPLPPRRGIRSFKVMDGWPLGTSRGREENAEATIPIQVWPARAETD